MQPENPSVNTWQRAEELFAKALLLPEDARETFLSEACGADEFLREEVLGLLKAGGRMSGFLENPVIDFRGETFGAYRAVEEIGRGGMSVVYSGQRLGEDFDRKVAIKVVLTQAGGAPETKMLAALEHPNVARLYDAGTTPIGFRYLVMEFVDGVPCTHYSVARTETEKLRLFLDLCAGVQAAHQALIVHRDLKPSNVLISCTGQLRILDFGISKMLTPTAEQTTGPRAYTIDYASPEQILGLPAGTANDVYSLGVILCEWLCGKLPRRLSHVSLEEARRLASTRSDLPPDLRGDLRRIVAKAVEPEAALRYESANALAEDLRRYLDGKAVLARPATFAYQASKFLARHRVAAALSLLTIVGLAASGMHAARQAQLANARFDQVRTLSHAVIFNLLDAVEPLAGANRAKQLIAQRSQAYLDVIARNPDADDEALLEAARGYLRLAKIANGESAGQRERAITICRQVLGRSPGNSVAQSLLAMANQTQPSH